MVKMGASCRGRSSAAEEVRIDIERDMEVVVGHLDGKLPSGMV